MSVSMPDATETKRRGRKPAKGGARLRMLQIRVNDSEYESLNEAARRRGMKVSDLVRSQLGAMLGTAPVVSAGGTPAADTTETPSSPSQGSETLYLPGWLAPRLGAPEPVAWLYISSGRVTVNGKRVHDFDVPAGAEVCFDGEPVQNLP